MFGACRSPPEPIRRGLETLCSAALAAACVYGYVCAPAYVCLLVKCDDTSTTYVKAMYPRLLAVTCLVSRAVAVWCKCAGAYDTYERTAGAYERRFAADDAGGRARRRLFVVAVVAAYAAVILPANAARAFLIYYYTDHGGLLMFYALMYAQNAAICSTEVHFMSRCYAVHQKFRAINDGLAAIRARTVAVNGYPDVLRDGDGRDRDGDPPDRLSDRIELFRMRHRFVRCVFSHLNDLYGVQVGLSLLLLFLLTLFDIYGEALKTTYFQTRSKLLFYGWMLQYSFRFCAIVFTAHSTTKQVGRGAWSRQSRHLTRPVPRQIGNINHNLRNRRQYYDLGSVLM